MKNSGTRKIRVLARSALMTTLGIAMLVSAAAPAMAARLDEPGGRTSPAPEQHAFDIHKVVDTMLGHDHDHGNPAPDSAKHDEHAHDCVEAFRAVRGQGRSCRTSNGMWKVDLGGGRFVITHGPDAIEPFESGQTGTLAGTPRAPLCASQNPHGAYGMLAILAYPSDMTPNETVSSIRARIAAINGAFYQAAVESGSPNGANLVYQCDSTGQTRVDVVQLGITASQTSFANITSGLIARGYTSGKLSVYWEANAQYGGEGTFTNDETDASTNPSNGSTYYNAPFFAIDYNQSNEVWMHEIGHNLGAVGPNAPYSTGTGAHCYEGKDVMCYTDGGSKDPGAITWNCLDGFDHFDCDHDTYFDAAIGAGQGRGTGSYLDTHWNIGECYVRFVVNAACSGGGDTTAPVMGTVSAAVASGYQVGSTLATRVSWSATDASGISRYSLWLSADGGVSWTDRSASLSSATATSIVFSLTPGTSYEFAVEAKDPAGNWSKFAYTPTFKPAIYDDTSVTYSTSWSRYAWSSAFGGYEVGSKTAAATASFTFTGLGVGWVAPKATNRGQAYVYIDGTYIGTVDLYSATTSAKPVVLSRYWTTRGTHTMTVKVVGTSGRPQVDVDAFATLR